MEAAAGSACTPAVSEMRTSPAPVPNMFQPRDTAAAATVDLSVEYITQNSYSGWIWECTEPWSSWKKMLSDCPKLKILELCCSGGSPTHALRSLGIPIEVYQWNSDLIQKSFLELANDSHCNIHCGPDVGSIMNNSIDGFPSAHWIFASPPLTRETAYMPLEVRGAIVRSEDYLAFHRTCAVIRHQANHGSLMNFVIEGEHWWLKVPPGNVCPLEYLKSELQRYLGNEWCVVTGTYNVADFALPQIRTKCYLRGYRRSLYANGVPVRVIPLSPAGRNQCKLRDLLIEPGGINSTITENGASSKNLKTGKELLKTVTTDWRNKDRIAVLPLDRKPLSIVTGWPSARSQISVDIVPELTKTDKVWLLSLDSLDKPSVHHLLQPYERGALQGFPRTVCKHHEVSSATESYYEMKKKVFSSAMPVPLIGAIIATNLLSIGRGIGFAALSDWISSGVLPAAVDPAVAASLLDEFNSKDTGRETVIPQTWSRNKHWRYFDPSAALLLLLPLLLAFSSFFSFFSSACSSLLPPLLLLRLLFLGLPRHRLSLLSSSSSS